MINVHHIFNHSANSHLSSRRKDLEPDLKKARKNLIYGERYSKVPIGGFALDMEDLFIMYGNVQVHNERQKKKTFKGLLDYGKDYFLSLIR